MKQVSYQVPMHCTYITTEAMTTAYHTVPMYALGVSKNLMFVAHTINVG